MKNKHVKGKTEVLRNFIWATMCVGFLLCAALGCIYYMLISNIQFSSVMGKLIGSVILIILLTAIFLWKSWYRNAFKKYTKEYEKEIEMLKSNRAFTVFLLAIIILGVGIGFSWYFGHHRPAQEMLNTEPVKIYKAVEPLKPNDQPSNTHEATTSVHSHEETTSPTPLVSDMENTDANLNLEQSDLSNNTKRSEDLTVSERKEEAEHKHTQSKAEQEASKKLIAEAEIALENAKQIQKEGIEMMRKAMPIVANHLNTLSTEEQIEMLRQLKTTMSSQVLQFPPEFQSLIEENNVVEEGWQMYLDMLTKAGYTPPRDFE